MIAGSQGTSRPRAVLRAGAATAGMSLGFLTVFGVFGLLISPVIASAQRYLPFATVVIGVLLVGLAIWLLAGKELGIILSKSMGVRRQLGSVPCTATAWATPSPRYLAPLRRFSR